MKMFSVVVLGVVAGLCAVPSADSAVQFGRARASQVCVYRDINYQGVEQCYSSGDQISSLGAQSKSISSIRIYGGATVTVFENTSFRGRSVQFTSDVPDLGRRVMAGNTTWSDHIDSLQIGGEIQSVTSNDDRNTRGLRRNQAQEPANGVCLYDRPNYEGRSQCWNRGQNISSLAGQGNLGGQVSSIRVFGERTSAVVYQDIGYRGESLIVDRDIPDLTAVSGNGNSNGKGNGNGNGRGRGNGRGIRNWDRQISSLQVQAR